MQKLTLSDGTEFFLDAPIPLGAAMTFVAMLTGVPEHETRFTLAEVEEEEEEE